VEPQHAAYVVQWFLFGGLALAAPFVLANAERRRDRDDDKPSLDDRLAGKA
jgi:cytochrome oxidase assembly protein ShyY1